MMAEPLSNSTQTKAESVELLSQAIALIVLVPKSLLLSHPEMIGMFYRGYFYEFEDQMILP